MKKMKSLIALCLIVCICLSSMAMFASAADTGATPNATERIIKCGTNAARLRSSPKEINDSNVIGLMYRDENFHTSSDASDDWYYGAPGPGTVIYQEYGMLMYGYIRSYFFYTAR